MAFMIHSTDDGRACPVEYLPCGAITPKAGMALVLDGGNLAAAAGADKPAYISMCEKAEACSAGDIIPVVRVQADVVFETVFGADAADVKPGDALTLSDDGMEVTATTGGSAEVVGMDGTAAGDAVRVRFA